MQNLSIRFVGKAQIAAVQAAVRAGERLLVRFRQVEQAEDLVEYIKKESETPQGVWGTNIFGKSIEELVMDGMKNKITLIGDESRSKLQDSMQKIVNDTNGGLICIII